MGSEYYESPERYELQSKINSLQRSINIRKQHAERYPKEEIDALYKKLYSLKAKRKALRESFEGVYTNDPDNRDQSHTVSIDVKIAQELFYPKSVQDALRNEPDAEKRQRILTNARNGIF